MHSAHASGRQNFHMRQLDCLMKIMSPDGIRNGEWGLGWNARPLSLWSTDCRIRNGTYPSLCPTHDWRLQFEDLEIQDGSSTYLHRTQLPVKCYGSLIKPTDSIDRISPYLIPNVSRGINAKTVPVTARIEQTIIKNQSKIRSRLLITS